mmetsp:Transcript_18103/g.51974  ORF Transcript_18103/g.51974 Transcript_18103/m.51974 type:complete len:90 (+) Transcript_18103:364-633(+)
MGLLGDRQPWQARGGDSQSRQVGAEAANVLLQLVPRHKAALFAAGAERMTHHHGRQPPLPFSRHTADVRSGDWAATRVHLADSAGRLVL